MPIRSKAALFLLVYAGTYLIGLFLIRGTGGATDTWEEALSTLVLFGIIFPAIAYPLLRRVRPLFVSPAAQRHELVALGLIVLWVTVYLGWGSGLLTPLQAGLSARAVAVLILVQKMLFLVLVPYFMLRYVTGLHWHSLGVFIRQTRSSLRHSVWILGTLGLLLLAFQWFVGNGAKPLHAGEFGTGQIIVATPLAFIWLALEVGVVEEFVFRVVLQSRLSMLLRSSTGGIVLSSLIFGLAHVPGMYLRGAGVLDELGVQPGLGAAAGFCITVLSPLGLFLGYLWDKTHNFLLLVLLHALIDLLPNLPEFMRLWGL